MDAPRLSLVLPIYNEERVLAAHLDRLRAALEDLGEPYEVVCVDDGSTDSSAALLAEAARRDPRLRTLSLTPNRGKGAAVRAGVLSARGARIVCMDADLSTDLEALPRALVLLDSGAPIVLGDRRIAGARVLARQPGLRERLGSSFAFLARRLVDPSVTDFTCGFKAFRAEPAARLFERVSVAGWAFDAEVLAIARQLGYASAALPVAWSDHAGSKVRLPGDATRALFDLVRIGWRARRGAYRA